MIVPKKNGEYGSAGDNRATNSGNLPKRDRYHDYWPTAIPANTDNMASTLSGDEINELAGSICRTCFERDGYGSVTNPLAGAQYSPSIDREGRKYAE